MTADLAAAALAETVAWLAARDADLGRAAVLAGPLPDRSRPPGFPALLRIVCEQQLSVASAAAIWTRIEAALQPLTPERLLAARAELASLGLSRPKVRYACALAEALATGRLDLDRLAGLDDRDALAALQAVTGIGRWTAEIYLLFALGRPDIWPADDLALQVSVQHLKRLPARPDRRRMDALAEPWRPHRGVAARLLWGYYRGLRNRPAAAAAAAASASDLPPS